MMRGTKRMDTRQRGGEFSQGQFGKLALHAFMMETKGTIYSHFFFYGASILLLAFSFRFSLKPKPKSLSPAHTKKRKERDKMSLSSTTIARAFTSTKVYQLYWKERDSLHVSDLRQSELWQSLQHVGCVRSLEIVWPPSQQQGERQLHLSNNFNDVGLFLDIKVV